MSTPSPANSEYLTRKRIIDSKLREAGWEVRPFLPDQPLSAYQNCAVEEYPTANGPADYTLCRGGQILGIVEAKKLSIGPQNVLLQAERYSQGISQPALASGPFGVPFLYSTNGEILWHHDIRDERDRSREIAAFHTPAALQEYLARDFKKAIANLKAAPNASPRLRPYQRDANDAIEAAIAARKRHMLVAMATGTGKTFTIVNEIYRLIKSGVAPRVLFLVDRRALAAQTVRAFASFEAEPGLKFNKIYEVYSQRFQTEDFGEEEKFDPRLLPNHYLENPQPGAAFVYVSTIQRTAINLFGRSADWGGGLEGDDEDAEQLPRLPIHAFDLIVADECHRGYTASQTAIWRKTLDHFDALKIGLTATPAGHTMSLFRDKVFEYNYETAVAEGFLVDYDVVKVKSNVRINGIFLKEGEEVGFIDPDTGATRLDYLEDERLFDTTQIERDITSPDSNRKILEELKTYALEHERTDGRFPKTLIFAANDMQHRSHAEQLVRLAREVFGRGDSFVSKITGSSNVDRPLQRIREFRNRPAPGIVVTVDMLTTGVDIPDLEYIVFLRPVKSRILFTQMMGRGTRKGERQISPTSSSSTVSTAVSSPTSKTPPTSPKTRLPEPPAKSPPSSTTSGPTAIPSTTPRCLAKRFQRIDKEMSGKARENFAAFIPDGDIAEFARDLPRRIKDDFAKTLALLRDPAFQDLLVNYQRRPSTFLTAFGEWVRTHETDIEAISVLLNRPRRWTPAVFSSFTKNSKPRPSASPSTISSAPTPSAKRNPCATSSRWSSTPPTSKVRSSPLAASSPPNSKVGSTVSAPICKKTSRSIKTTSNPSLSSPASAAGAAPRRVLTGNCHY